MSIDTLELLRKRIEPLNYINSIRVVLLHQLICLPCNELRRLIIIVRRRQCDLLKLCLSLLVVKTIRQISFGYITSSVAAKATETAAGKDLDEFLDSVSFALEE